MKASICIANYKQDDYLKELVRSTESQNHKDIELCIYHDKEGIGSGEAFNRAISMATGDIIVLMCADDLFTGPNVISDIVQVFQKFPDASHVSRFYYQFIDGDPHPVRAWRIKDPIELANNPSGLAFRKSMLGDSKLTNKMFVEAPTLVKAVLDKNPWNVILDYDTVSVRIHNSTARSKDYYLKRWTSSPVEEWVKLGGKSLLNDFTSLIQIKNYYTNDAVLKEAKNFIRLKPINIIRPAFWFYALVALLTPRSLLLRIPNLYRRTFGRWTTRQICRQK